MNKLSEEAVTERLEKAEGWSREDGKWISKKYRFSRFLDGVAFVQEVANMAEKELNHHPMIAIDYKLVTLRLTSWNAGGLTELDFTAAARFDAAFEMGTTAQAT
ncbi:4a-hydroxytetrahydrobiopterin dehydratase [Paenibacillus sp. FSL H7-0331]|jgi:4a-hydroxytetrahydrobiopterin dehydratase|uniref:4a-hydroxytetrahydrobiopterin dehydratase n=1 Tax=Paenibacillus sp. FSL H7-0331 TaxID=1920421 RepID=UPI00096E5414|nr:4a-hydroxytetrahydrobiopterin dehydratase [Paenibacillus sp. FSL H7-0331]OMF03522.1 pterin-4-alpha-carbinolamine dehydratase [Paenibacillus sp. FSL H7-0331]